MPDPFAHDPEFRKLIQGESSIDLARVNLEIARDAYPDLEAGPSMEIIGSLASRVSDRCPAGSRSIAIIGQINWVLFVEEGFRGNTEDYHDPRNSYLHEVLKRKLGLPISLSVLYAAVAGRVGLEVAGVNLPAHFLLRVVSEPSPLFIDPFHEGRMLDREGCEQFISEILGQFYGLDDSRIAPADDRTVVSRMLRNLKVLYLERVDYLAALPVTRRLAALHPSDLIEVRDWGLTCIQADRPGEAIGPLGRYVDENPQGPDTEEVRSVWKAARREVASRN